MPRPAAAALLILLVAAAPAFAYVDPGAGSLLLQLILGGIGGLLITLKLFWRRVRPSRDKTE